MLKTGIAILLLLFSACIGVVHGTEVALCTDASDQIGPDVYGHYVVWEDHRGSLPRIDLYDIDTGRTAVIPPPLESSSQYAPAIFGDSVVYVSSKGGDYEVRLYSISAGTSAVIRDSAYLLETPDVYSSGGDAVDVVWAEYTPNETYPVANSDIYRYTRTPLGIMTTTRISTGLYESAPRIYGNTVVWMHRVGSLDETTYHDDYLVYAQTGRNPAEVISTTTTDEKNYHPDLQGGRVVWQDSPTADQEFSTVLLSQVPPLSTDPRTLRPATPAPARITSYRQPAIWGSSVVYVDADSSVLERSLRLMDLGSDLDYYLSPSTHVSYPRIQGDTVVWQDNRAGNWDIYMARTGPTPVTGCTVIDQPGYYALSADILDSFCPVAIDIRCSDVLLDGQNHLVDGRDTAGTTGIRIQASPTTPLTNVEVRNLRLTDWATGFSGACCSDCTLSAVSASSGGEGFSFLLDSHDNTVTACSTSDNSGTGLSAFDDCSVTLTACIIANNGGSGVDGDTSRIVCNDSVIAGNGFGAPAGGDGFSFIRAGGNFYNNTIRDNRGAGLFFNHDVGGMIAGNTITGNAVGISDNNFVGEGGSRTIYNNLLNNTLNTDANLPETWSVTARPGPNIVGGPSIGGNYWAQPDGNGFSQTHADLDHDGFCDAPYTVTPASFDLAAGIDQLPLSETFRVRTIPGALVPRDLDLNGRYEDVNGNGRPDFADVVLFFNQMTWITANEPNSAFDYNGNGRIDFADIVWLFNNL